MVYKNKSALAVPDKTNSYHEDNLKTEILKG
jgi:hypothetical protein